MEKGGKPRLKNMKIDANGTEIRVMGDVVNEDAYISLTDIAKYKNSDNAFIVVANWMRNHSTISFLGLWEQIHNPNFKPIEFDRFKAESGDNAFTLTPQQWIKATDAIGIVSKSGRYGGTYAHTDIAFEFASWISPEFKLYIIKDYQRLKKDEADRLAIGWDVKRELSKINHRIHTDAVKEFLITPTLSPQCIFRKNCASVPEERSAIPLQTEQSSAGLLVTVVYSTIPARKFKTICLGCHSA